MPPDPEHQPQAALADLRSWDELERWVSAAAKRAGCSSAEALKDLRRKGAFVRLLCAELGVSPPPRSKPGPKPRPVRDTLIEQLRAHAETKLGLRGAAMWDWVHSQLDNPEALFGDKLSVTGAAMKRRYYRSRQTQAE